MESVDDDDDDDRGRTEEVKEHTSAFILLMPIREVIFIFVNKNSHKLLDGMKWNLVEGWDMSPGRTH